MTEEIPQEVIESFSSYSVTPTELTVGEISIEKMGGGLINHSYKVACQFKSDFLLQKINTSVFANPEDVQENYLAIWQHIEFEFKGLKLPLPKYWSRNSTLFIDDNENYWRAFEFIHNASMLQVATKPAQAKATAAAFAKFTASFDDFNVQLLKTVIPDFHNLTFRYQQFEAALDSENYERMAKALQLINELKSRERYKHFYEIIINSNEFPLRVTHHDAKISNILFNKENDDVICLVDFDTVMPGYFFSDLGDIIRSMICSEDENSIAFEKITARKDFYRAILDGYLPVMDKQLTAEEKKYIHSAGLLMIYMQALRFLTDYLAGDIYYQTDYPEHNFNRAKNQFVLLQQLEELLKAEYNFSL